MPPLESTTNAPTNFVSAMPSNLRRWAVRVSSLARSMHHRAPHSKLLVAAMAGLAAVVILALKFAAVLHVLIRLADVGRNIHPMGPAAAGAGGAGAAGGAAGGPPDKSKPPDPCAGERRAVFVDQSRIDTYKDQLNYYSNQIDKLANPAKEMLAKAADLAPQAGAEVTMQFAQTLIQKLLEVTAEVLAGGSEGVETVKTTIDAVTNPLSQVPGQSVAENINFFKELYPFYQISQGDMNALEKLCEENNLPATQQFVDVMKELNSLVAQGNTLAYQMSEIQVSMKTAEDQLSADQQALADCEANNTGDGAAAAAD
jgi:hypothetical protein